MPIVAAMANFRIWGRVEQVDVASFMVVASAVSPWEDAPGTSTVVITDRAVDEVDARDRLGRMVARLDARVRAGGNTVSSIDIR